MQVLHSVYHLEYNPPKVAGQVRQVRFRTHQRKDDTEKVGAGKAQGLQGQNTSAGGIYEEKRVLDESTVKAGSAMCTSAF